MKVGPVKVATEMVRESESGLHTKHAIVDRKFANQLKESTRVHLPVLLTPLLVVASSRSLVHQ